MNEVPFGEVITTCRDAVRLVPDETYATVGILSYGRGLFSRPVVQGRDVSYSTYYRIAADQFVYSKLFAWEGALTVVPRRFHGYFVSQEFPTFTVDAQVALPSYIRLLTTWPTFWERVREGESGMGGRRKRVHPERLMAVSIPLPSLPSQRRIVDLIEAVEASAVACSELADASEQAARSLIEEGLESAPRSREVGDLILDIQAGKSPPAEDRSPAPGELAVLKVSAVRPGFFEPREAKVISSADGFPSHAVLRSGDLLITRANTRELVGSVCRVADAPSGYFLCDKTLRLVPNEDLVSPDYLLLALQSRNARRQIEDAATGSSASMKNITQGSIRSLRIPLVERHGQDRWTSAILAAKAGSRSANRYLQATVELRGALLQELLTDENRIPDSYDRFLEPSS